jgi:Mce-associated membrane protein
MATKLFKRTNDKDVFDTIIDHDNPPAAEDAQAITDSDDSETSKTADRPPDDDNTATAPADTDNQRTAPTRRARRLFTRHTRGQAVASSQPETTLVTPRHPTHRPHLASGGCATPSPRQPF